MCYSVSQSDQSDVSKLNKCNLYFIRCQPVAAVYLYGAANQYRNRILVGAFYK